MNWSRAKRTAWGWRLADCLDCLHWKEANKLRATTKSRGKM